MGLMLSIVQSSSLTNRFNWTLYLLKNSSLQNVSNTLSAKQYFMFQQTSQPWRWLEHLVEMSAKATCMSFKLVYREPPTSITHSVARVKLGHRRLLEVYCTHVTAEKTITKHSYCMCSSQLCWFRLPVWNWPQKKLQLAIWSVQLLHKPSVHSPFTQHSLNTIFMITYLFLSTYRNPGNPVQNCPHISYSTHYYTQHS